ncbi:MAG TPA: SDR family oxidoreductase [Candidatus Eisenbacteria bacterium]|nr:SDR family oxidoreductase [Candidatus Eisenbacteria bacterium]
MNLGLDGRTALVLGASSGLGLASAQALREEGANVVMFARREGLLRQEAGRLDATAVAGDLSRHADLHRAVDVAVRMHGGLDVIVLNGGGPPPGTASQVADDTIQGAVDLLLRPIVALVSAALPHLRKSGQGRVISISSISAREPIPGLALSNAIRPGVWGYLKTLAGELAGDAITVNSVGPGRIATARMNELYGGEPPQAELDAIPLGRLGTPRELGDVVCFLASRQASYITGAMIRVDGGLSKSL